MFIYYSDLDAQYRRDCLDGRVVGPEFVILVSLHRPSIETPHIHGQTIEF